MSRLYVIVRNDIPPGLQLAQACHATREFGKHYPFIDVGENLVVLQVPNESELRSVVEACHGFMVAPFHEPDLGGEMTAVAISGAAKGRLRRLSLALSAA